MKKTISAFLCLMILLGAVTLGACNKSESPTDEPTDAPAPSDSGASHEHKYSSSLSYDDTMHFKACTVEGCTSRSNSKAHTFNEISKSEEDGTVTRTYKCKDCDYTKAESNEEYKVISSNLLGKYPQHASEDATTEERMKTISELIASYAPDSVGFQEFGSQNKLFLNKHLPKEYAFVNFGQEWIPTIYNSDRLTLEHAACKMLTTSSNQKYCFTMAVFSSKASGELAYIHGNLHLEYKDAETRLIDAAEINDALWELFDSNENYASLPLVITGDYNATIKDEPQVFNIIGEGHGIKTASVVASSAEDGEATYHHSVGRPAGKGNAIDHVLVKCDTTKVYLHNIIKENDYADILSASDHYPVLVEFSAANK